MEEVAQPLVIATTSSKILYCQMKSTYAISSLEYCMCQNARKWMEKREGKYSLMPCVSCIDEQVHGHEENLVDLVVCELQKSHHRWGWQWWWDAQWRRGIGAVELVGHQIYKTKERKHRIDPIQRQGRQEVV
jgi:hypothetical protein